MTQALVRLWEDKATFSPSRFRRFWTGVLCCVLGHKIERSECYYIDVGKRRLAGACKRRACAYTSYELFDAPIEETL